MAAINPTATLAITPQTGYFTTTTFTVYGQFNGTISGTLTPATGTAQVQMEVLNTTWTNVGSPVTLDGTGSFSWSGQALAQSTNYRVVFTSSNTAVWNNLTSNTFPITLVAAVTPQILIDSRQLIQSQNAGGSFNVTAYLSYNKTDGAATFGLTNANEMTLNLNGVPYNKRQVPLQNIGSSGVGYPTFQDSNVYSFTVPVSALTLGSNSIIVSYSGSSRLGVTLLPGTSAPMIVTLISPKTYTVNIPSTCTNATAVVTGSTGKQIRTIWANRALTAGINTVDWDGLDDAGNAPPTDTYTVTVLSGNPQFTWLGVIGNTSYDVATASPNFIGTNVWDQAGSWPADMCISGSRAYFAGGYSERKPSSLTAILTAINSPQIMNTFVDLGRQVDYSCTDGTNVYFVNTGSGASGQIACVVAYSATTPYTQFPFTSGSTAPVGSPAYTGVIDLGTVTGATLTNVGTGIAVQTSGTILAVAHGNFYTSAQNTTVTNGNIINLFNKTTGAGLGSITITNPRRMAFDTSGNLWVISGGTNLTGTTVTQYTSISSSPTVGLTLSGIVAPISISCDPTTGDVVVVDGGTSQQVKRFSSSSGSLISTIGVAGGMTDGNANITNTRFFFDTTAGQGGHGLGLGIGSISFKSWVCVAPDSSIYFSDSGNMRIMHFSSTGTYIERITFFPSNSSYTMVVDRNDPTSVFASWLEYTIDYTKTLAAGDPDPALGGNGAWTLARNWSVAFPTTYAYPISVATLNSTPYALMNYNTGLTSYGSPAVTGSNTSATHELVSLNKSAGTATRSGVQTYAGTASFSRNSTISNVSNTFTTIGGVPVVQYLYTSQAVSSYSGGFPVFATAVTQTSLTVPNISFSFTAVLTSGSVTSLTRSVTNMSGLPNGNYPLIFTGTATTSAAGYMTITGAVPVTSGIGFAGGTIGYVLTSGGTGYSTAPTVSFNIGQTYPVLNEGWGGYGPFDISTGGYMAYFQSGVCYVQPSWHLAGVKTGNIAQSPTLGTLAWLGMPSGSVLLPDGQGTFSIQNGFGGHNGQQVLTVGAYFIGTYDGQYGPYSNQYMMYTEDGIFVGQFGVAPTYNAIPAIGLPLQAGCAGNIGRFCGVLVGSDIYCYSTDEGLHAGLAFWHVSNLSSLVRTVAVPTQPSMGIA